MNKTCRCPVHRQRLYTMIEGTRYEAEPTLGNTATSILFRAWCSRCSGEYAHPFRVVTRSGRAA
jgi:hypothetical protein